MIYNRKIDKKCQLEINSNFIKKTSRVYSVILIFINLYKFKIYTRFNVKKIVQ